MNCKLKAVRACDGELAEGEQIPAPKGQVSAGCLHVYSAKKLVHICLRNATG